MLSYYFKSRQKIDSKNTRFTKTNKGKLTILSKCTVFNNKKLRFIK